jgi:hypothetical protein
VPEANINATGQMSFRLVSALAGLDAGSKSMKCF